MLLTHEIFSTTHYTFLFTFKSEYHKKLQQLQIENNRIKLHNKSFLNHKSIYYLTSQSAEKPLH